MIIKILGAESLGVRRLSCVIELKNRKLFIDPGIAPGWTRHGFSLIPFRSQSDQQSEKKSGRIDFRIFRV